jgi:hypothetical protein
LIIVILDNWISQSTLRQFTSAGILDKYFMAALAKMGIDPYRANAVMSKSFPCLVWGK